MSHLVHLIRSVIMRPLGSVLLLKMAVLPALADTARSRDPAVWPFDSKSLWNQPIGSDARYEPIRCGLGNAVPGCEGNRPTINTHTYSVNLYFSRPADPNTLMQNWFGNVGNQCAGQAIPIPAEAEPSKGSDGHIAILDPSHVFVYETGAVYHERKPGLLGYPGGVINGWLWFRNDTRGMGMGRGGAACGTRASGFPSIAGLIRKGELANGVPHVLALATSRANLCPNGPDGRSWVWPALSSDYVFPHQYFPKREPLPKELATEGWYKRQDGNLFVGSLVAIPAGVDIEALAFRTVGGKAVAKALQDYGAYVADMGDAPFALFAEPGVSGECGMGEVIGDLQQLQPLLRIVANNAPEKPGGGGTPRAPLAPPIDPAFYGPGLPPVDPGFLGLPPSPKDVMVLERE